MECHTIFKLIIIILCFAGVYGLYWPCNSDTDCNTTEGAFCLNNVCQCSVGYVFSEDITTCIKESLYGEECVASSQCSHMLTGSKCAGVCECVEGYSYIRGRCKQLVELHSPCNQDTDCFFGYDRDSVVCKENLCECSEDFYERSENICRRKSMNAGDPCAVHQDCHGDNLECIGLTCTPTTDSTNTNSGRRLSREIGIQTSIDVIETKDVSTSIDKSTILVPEKAPKVQGRQFGTACTAENAPCDEFSHSVCLQGVCQCRKGYYLKDGLCKAEIGEVADSAELCEGADAFFDPTTRKCSCIRNYFALNNLRSCIKPSPSFANSCTEQSQCTPYGAAYCPGLDQRRLCTCHNYAVYDPNTQLCVPKTGLGSLCRPTADDCSTREANTVCSTNNNLCSCQEKYIEVDGKCKPGENVNCTQDSDCAMRNSECTDGGTETNNKVCKCRKGFLFIKDDCMKEATEYNEECIETEQCKPLLGDLGKCVDFKCACEDHLHHNKGKCYEKRALGDKCTRSAECFVTAEPDQIECRNAVCECPFGTQKDVERQVCRPVAKKNSSDRPSVLKVITLMLTTAAILITTAAIKEAYY